MRNFLQNFLTILSFAMMSVAFVMLTPSVLFGLTSISGGNIIIGILFLLAPILGIAIHLQLYKRHAPTLFGFLALVPALIAITLAVKDIQAFEQYISTCREPWCDQVGVLIAINSAYIALSGVAWVIGLAGMGCMLWLERHLLPSKPSSALN